jgi:uncharacterized protein YvpB
VGKYLFSFALGLAVILASPVVIPSFAQAPSTVSGEGSLPKKVIPKPPAPKLALKNEAFIRVNAISQLPELISGCEVTSLTMLLDFAGKKVNKLNLAHLIEYDPTPKVTDKYNQYQILTWGNPDKGFVGKMNGTDTGYGVYHKPLFRLLNKILPDQGVDLTGQSFAKMLQSVSDGIPVIAWTTTDFSPSDIWEDWNSPTGKIHATFKEHAVLVIGYDQNSIYVNDPLDGTAGKQVDRKKFEATWNQMGRQAITLKENR